MEESPLRPGYRLDRYELLCPVAAGGMAQVWLARLRGKRDFEKLYAIKTIKTELGEDARFQEMFLDEARIASGIEHPNVAHLLDLGDQDGVLYIVMEWVDGESLAKVSRQARRLDTPLPLALSLRIMADACAGLHAAHELKDKGGQHLGVVHRDVSPQNILVAVNGAVKVIDFGVAKARNRKAGETGTGIVKGKVRFMAPEQVRAQPLDRRADLWAIGVCLFELATGRLPFDDGESGDVDVVRRLLSDEPLPKFDEVPGPVAEILSHSLVRDVNERFASGAAMRRAIEHAMAELKLHASSEDIAEFVAAHLPEFAEKRHAVIARAMAEADQRSASRGTLSSLPAPEEHQEAFAPTIMSQHTPSHSAVRAPTPLPSARAVLEGRDETTTGGAFTEDEMAALPKKRGLWWLGALAAVCAAAWFGWPGGPRIRAFAAGLGTQTPPRATTEPSATPPTVTSAPSATAEDAAPAVSVSASASVSAPPSASVHPRPRPTSQDIVFTPAPVPTTQPVVTPPTSADPKASGDPPDKQSP